MTSEAIITRSHQLSPASNKNYTRLHITPLDEELLKIIIPASAHDSARDISLHSIETFPENRYGFVSLPPTEAEKLQRKLNGVIIKGAKMRIEKARPEKEVDPSPKTTTRGNEPARKTSSPREKKKEKKRADNVVEGVLLQDRKVKRGWTEAADTKRKRRKTGKDDSKSSKKSRPKSKYTEQDECLLKTKVPPNAVGNLSASAVAGSNKKKKKKTQTSATTPREVTVHEFEKTTKFPSFLKADSSGAAVAKPAREFVEGKGWVDDDGELVEAVPLKTNKTAKSKVEQEPDSTSGSSSGDGETSSDEEEKEEEEEQKSEDTSETSSSGSESSVTQDQEQQDTPDAQPPSRPKTALDRPSSSSAANLVIKIPPPPATPGKDIHPLEALYKKRSSVDDGPAEQTFSFFGTNDDADDDNDGSGPHLPPLTPYTRADLEWRNLRSAAPTPDTAQPSRAKYFWSPAESQDVAQTEEDAPSPTRDGDDTEQHQKIHGDGDGDGASDFQAWFWQNRRDLIRSWMTRRKTAAKDKRHRENKARASKTI